MTKNDVKEKEEEEEHEQEEEEKWKMKQRMMWNGDTEGEHKLLTTLVKNSLMLSTTLRGWLSGK